MRCRQCEYPLWNLSARQCPECGTPFAPSEYEFMLNSIKYCCPDCGQQYYGTGKNGHLVPDEFDCVGCKRHLHMDEMVLLPAEGVSERQTEFHSTPWIDRSRRGYISSWIRMIGWSMARPKQLAEGFPVEGGLGHAFKFALSLWVIGLLLGSSIFAVLFLLLSFNLGGGFGIYELYGLFIALISGIVIGLLGTLVWGCVTHLLLMISGGSLHPLNRTLALGYLANGPMILLSIPCIGVYCFVPVAVAWAMISYSILIFYGQKVSAIRSIFSVLALPLLIGLVVGALYTWAIMEAVSGQNRNRNQVAQVIQPIETSELSNLSMVNKAMLDAWVASDPESPLERRWPGHVLELVRNGRLSPLSLVTDPDTELIPATTAMDMALMSQDELKVVIDRHLEVEGDSFEPYVIENTTYCHRGIGEDRSLWLFVVRNGPDRWHVFSPHPVNTMGYSMGFASKQDFLRALASQNQQRVERGLPPLDLGIQSSQ